MRLIRRPVAMAFLLALAAAPASAGPSHYGMRAGVNLSAFTGSITDLVEPDNRVAANVAFVYEYDFVPQLSLHTGLGYSGKGGVTHSESVDIAGNPIGSVKETWSFDYLEVPLLMRGRMHAFGASHVFLELGPMLDFRLSGNLGVDEPSVPDLSLTTRMKTFDLGFGVGAGLEFTTGPGRLGVEARYTHGFDDLFDTNGTLTTINQAWTFALSYTR